jgi:hypothetical protein
MTKFPLGMGGFPLAKPSRRATPCKFRKAMKREAL